MRAYTVAAAAATLRVTLKWLDNALTHHTVAGVTQSRQGVARRLTPNAILTIEIAIRLKQSAAVPLGSALKLAAAAVREGDAVQGPAAVKLDDSIGLTLDLRLLRHQVASRLADAVEIAPSPRRGRPPN